MTKTVLLASLLAGCLMPIQPGSSGGTYPSSTSSSAAPSEPQGSEPSPAMGYQREPERASAPAAPTTASVTIRSACRKTAKVFYGNKPGFSSGTQSSISSNSVQSKTFRIGDQMWVTDDSGKGLDSVTIDAHTRQIEITSGCDGLSTR